ncbi:MAG: GNAT family N-acetyltransferase [Rhodococcus sp.]|nr:GNAT family N-acetyltransferase [Rhodococcus sp. (in: high G+C Gram-positive bacteria)]
MSSSACPDSGSISVLDHPVWASLEGAHARLARRVGGARAYLADVSTFCAVAPPSGSDMLTPSGSDMLTPSGSDMLMPSGSDEWADVARLLGPGGFADMFDCPVLPPAHWETVFAVDGLQLLGPARVDRRVVPDLLDGAELVELGDADRGEMLDLAGRTRPGPFWSRTPDMGLYLGVRRGGELVAMAGERLRPPGWTEISAVCTAPEARGRGYAAHLVAALVDRISDRGDHPFLHVVHDNVGAIELYARLGFRVRREVTFRGFRVPDSDRRV